MMDALWPSSFQPHGINGPVSQFIDMMCSVVNSQAERIRQLESELERERRELAAIRAERTE